MDQYVSRTLECQVRRVMGGFLYDLGGFLYDTYPCTCIVSYCIVMYREVYLDVSRSYTSRYIKIHQDTSRYIRIHQDTLYLALRFIIECILHVYLIMYLECIPDVSNMYLDCLSGYMYPTCIPHVSCISDTDAFVTHVSHIMYPECIPDVYMYVILYLDVSR